MKLLTASLCLTAFLACTLAMLSVSRGSALQYGVRAAAAPRVAYRAPVSCSRTQQPRRQFRSYAQKEEPGMVPDKNEPDNDLVPADGGLLDSIFNKWLVKASPTRSIVLDRQAQMNEERKQKGGSL